MLNLFQMMKRFYNGIIVGVGQRRWQIEFKKKKATLLGKMEQYFLGKRSFLPKQARSNQGYKPTGMNL